MIFCVQINGKGPIFSIFFPLTQPSSNDFWYSLKMTKTAEFIIARLIAPFTHIKTKDNTLMQCSNAPFGSKPGHSFSLHFQLIPVVTLYTKNNYFHIS